ncbi:hypothetical protein B0H13DRAFT_2337592 [Mycena leptocephala]|nr:hypothetical protein B0H13DRAFT_2337592 [Mycena leptocephala]
MSIDDCFPVHDSDDSAKLNEEPNMPELTTESAPPPSQSIPINAKLQAAQSRRKRKAKAKPDFAIMLTRFTVPEGPTAYLCDLTKSKALLTAPNGKVLSLDAYIRSEAIRW